MPRTIKNVAEYFPHDAMASAGDTVGILEDNFGNDGYTFWFKLLEKLTGSEGHVFDANDEPKWNKFCLKAHITPKLGVTIVDMLAELEAIDRELWQNKVIWCQHLVNNLAEVYKNRKRALPLKPIITTSNGITTVTTPSNGITTVTTPSNGITTSSGTPPPIGELKKEDATIYRARVPNPPPESRVEKSRVEKSRVEGITAAAADNSGNKNIFTLYEQEIGKLTEMVTEELKDIEKTYPAEWVTDAFKEAVTHNVRNLPYVEAILKRWFTEGRGGQLGDSAPVKKGRFQEAIGKPLFPTREFERGELAGE